MDVGCQRTVEASAAAPAAGCCSGDERQGTQARQCGREQLRPWPTFGQTEDGSARGVDEAAGNDEDPEAHRRGDGQLIVGVDAAEGSGPANQIVGEHRDPSQAALAKNRPEGQCSRPAPSLGPGWPARRWRGLGGTGRPRPPRARGWSRRRGDASRAKLSLHSIGQPGAANNQAHPTLGPLRLAPTGDIDGLRHLGGTAVGVGDVVPRILGNGGDCPCTLAF